MKQQRFVHGAMAVAVALLFTLSNIVFAQDARLLGTSLAGFHPNQTKHMLSDIFLTASWGSASPLKGCLVRRQLSPTENNTDCAAISM